MSVAATEVPPYIATLAEAVQRWTLHCAQRPEDLAAAIQLLRRETGGALELDAHNALLADVLQGVHTLIKESSGA